jgi:hypothetical protein
MFLRRDINKKRITQDIRPFASLDLKPPETFNCEFETARNFVLTLEFEIIL